MSTARRILENTAVQFGGKIITAVLSILVVKMLTAYLSPAQVGDYNAAYNFLAFFGIAADFGLYTIAVREMSKDETKIPDILGNVLGVRTVLILITMTLATVTAFLIPRFENTLVPIGVLIGAFATLFTLLNGTISTVLQAHLKMQYTTIGLVIGKIVSIAYMALVVYFLFPGDKLLGFEHLMWSGAAGNAVMFLITFYYVSKYTKIRYLFDFSYWKKIFLASLPYGVALVLSGIYFRIDSFLFYQILPPVEVINGEEVCNYPICAQTQAALYSIGLRFLEILVVIPVYYMNSVTPTITRFLQEGKEKVQRVIQYSFDFLFSLSFPILVGGSILSVPIVHLIAQEKYISGNLFTYGADVAVQFLLFAMLFSFMNVIFAFTLVILDKHKKLIYINLACVIFNIIGNFLVIPQWGFRGAAFTTILCEIFILLATIYAVKQDVKIHLSFKTPFKIFISGLTMGLILWLSYHAMSNLWFIWQLVILVPLGALVYGGMLLLTQTITPEMRAVLRRK